MNNLVVRAITGGLFVSLVLGGIFLGMEAQMAVFSLFVILGADEYFKLFENVEGVGVNRAKGIFFVVISYLIFISWFLLLLVGFEEYLILAVPFTIFLVELWNKKGNPVLSSAVILFGIVYMIVPFYCAMQISARQEIFQFDFPLLAAVFILVWTNDVFAYLTGKYFGKTKLIEHISPNKTWEGTIGGIVVTMLAGTFFGFYVYENPFLWIFGSFIIALSAIYGDLFESKIKRSLNVKDSGTILPGHGGILDRFDATFFAIPFFYVWYMMYLYIV